MPLCSGITSSSSSRSNAAATAAAATSFAGIYRPFWTCFIVACVPACLLQQTALLTHQITDALHASLYNTETSGGAVCASGLFCFRDARCFFFQPSCLSHRNGDCHDNKGSRKYRHAPLHELHVYIWAATLHDAQGSTILGKLCSHNYQILI